MSQIGNVGKLRNVAIRAVCSPFRLLGNNNKNKAGNTTKAFSSGRGSFFRMQQNNKDEYANPYPDFDANNGHGIWDLSSKQLDKTLVNKIQSAANQFTETVNTEGDRTSDYSVYTGITGIALLNFLISQRFNDSKALAKADDLLRRAPMKVHKSRITFLQDTGPVAVAAVVAHYLGKASEAKKNVSRLMAILDDVIASNPETPDECLYGRVGYLYSLLFVRKHLGPQSIDPAALKKVVGAVLSSGKSRAALLRSKVPLVFQWHGKNYYGAAHGVSGILQLLLQSGVLSAEDKVQLIKPTLDDLIAQRLPSGNFPSSQGSRSDRLVQWCHGAPGFAELLATAYKEFGEERYRTVALESGEVVWQRGLCTKGYSICHGVSGNAYTFLQLYQMTGDPKHLYRAGCFADWCLSLPKHQQLQPDRPFSLFEGLAGVAYFLVDVQDPSKAGFPAYNLQL
ncbi:glutathione S-transferase LANCL1 isoform X1 [Homalodisca vitripennis]|uniref:glutathione S-transferase LANCL1 isoform X1 n=2 Tax=Homalodisca vitripennis TaxID=197043 RepID=UPI001EEA7786|nr:glutathione S-transferase LANCL1 isoform X1 [Homalodisca vitripennis]